MPSVVPPHTYSTWPVTKPLSGARKNSVARATSSGVPMRLTAMLSMIRRVCGASGGLLLWNSAVAIGPGQTALDAADFALVYGSAPLLAAGQRGGGASIAVLARSNYLDADVAAFGERFTTIAPRLPVRIFSTPGADPGIGEESDAIEVLLDVQWAGAIAPEATVRTVIATPAADIPEALEVAGNRLRRFGDRVQLVRANYADAAETLSEPLAGALLDLGISSHQIDDPARGFVRYFWKAAPA